MPCHTNKTHWCFAIFVKFRDADPAPNPIVVYSNLCLKRGIETFFSRMTRKAGVDSILIADVHLREAEVLLTVANSVGINNFNCSAYATRQKKHLAHIGPANSTG